MTFLVPLVLLALVSPRAVRVDEIPASFRGTWEPDLSACESRSDMVLEIEASRVTFHGASGPLLAVVRRGDEIVVPGASR